VKGYLTLNTLIHSDELPAVESLLREVIAAQVDAVIIQDIGVARLAQRLCSDLPLHASTQMSLTSAASMELAATLGIKRVVLPRELSIRQIALLRRSVGIELECFIHGALCISYSGQCYASLGLGSLERGGRSANRGCCAQPCRLPYAVVHQNRLNHLDNNAETELSSQETRDICTEVKPALPAGTRGERKPILSPHDLAALPLLPKLIATGIHAFKIEGRLKPPEYVAEVTKIYRKALDHFAATRD
jgi:putative protease